MVSSLYGNSYPHHPLAHRAAIVFFSLQSPGEGGRFGFFPAPRAAVHDPWRLAGLCGDSLFDQLVSRDPVDAPSCCWDAVVSWPSLCIAAWGITPPAPICFAIQLANYLYDSSAAIADSLL